jgi:hypothetical protein
MDAESSFVILASTLGKTCPIGASSNSLTGWRATEDGHAQKQSMLMELIADIDCCF